MPAIDVTAAAMLAGLADDLHRDGVRLVLARSLGQVRDVLSVAEEGRPALPVYPTVRAAVAGLDGGAPDGGA